MGLVYTTKDTFFKKYKSKNKVTYLKPDIYSHNRFRYDKYTTPLPYHPPLKNSWVPRHHLRWRKVRFPVRSPTGRVMVAVGKKWRVWKMTGGRLLELGASFPVPFPQFSSSMILCSFLCFFGWQLKDLLEGSSRKLGFHDPI